MFFAEKRAFSRHFFLLRILDGMRATIAADKRHKKWTMFLWDQEKTGGDCDGMSGTNLLLLTVPC